MTPVEALPPIGGMGAGMIALTILGGLATLIAGAWLLVEGATGIARALGISETVIGLTIVAVGTSLPELATSVIAARRGEAGLALGNILGSNVFNLLAILGLTAVIVPIPVPPGLSVVDLVHGGRVSGRCCWRCWLQGGSGGGAGLGVPGALRGLHGVARARRCLIFGQKPAAPVPDRRAPLRHGALGIVFCHI